MTPRERAELITKELEAEGDKLWHPRLFYDETADAIEQAIIAAVEEEREACAELARKVRFGTSNEWIRQTSTDIEALIRARSTTAE